MTATMHYAQTTEMVSSPLPLRDHIAQVLDTYFRNMQGETPENVYHLVMTEVEQPLLEAVMKFTGNNQSQAAKILGINRGTFRKKLAFYGML